MKKTLFIFAVAAVLGLADCQPKATNKDGNQPQETAAEQPEENQKIGKCILYQGDGKLSFYDIAAQTTRLCVEENGKVVGFVPGESDFTADLISLDPEGKRALVFFNGVMGDGIIGIYNVSTLDGKEQYVLPGSSDESHPQWLEDGSLAYVNFDDDPTLCIMDPDGTLHKIGNATDFVALP